LLKEGGGSTRGTGFPTGSSRVGRGRTKTAAHAATCPRRRPTEHLEFPAFRPYVLICAQNSLPPTPAVPRLPPRPAGASPVEPYLLIASPAGTRHFPRRFSIHVHRAQKHIAACSHSICLATSGTALGCASRLNDPPLPRSSILYLLILDPPSTAHAPTELTLRARLLKFLVPPLFPRRIHPAKTNSTRSGKKVRGIHKKLPDPARFSRFCKESLQICAE
jgi:hypothetical protein